MNDAARWPVLHDAFTSTAQVLGKSGVNPPSSAWCGVPESLGLLSRGDELPAMIYEAASWAERITLCTTAPQSERGTLPWWRELLARNTKCEGIYVRHPERAESWLLQRLHGAGALRLVGPGGKQVASNLLMFARGDELRVVLTHIPLERAVAGAAFGALLSFRGASGTELARACRAQVESWSELARSPSGSEIDALTLDPRRRTPLPAFELPRLPRASVEPDALAAALKQFGAAIDATPGAATWELGASVRPFAGGYRVSLPQGESSFVLTLHTGSGWAAGNALLLEDGAGRSLLLWRGGLLGPSRSRSELMWSEARLPSFLLEDSALGLLQRVGVVACSEKALEPQLAAFARELSRLSDVFGVEPPPALGHVLSDFGTLSPKQQTLLVRRALLGTGALTLAAAATIAVETLRDQGYLRGQVIEPGSAAHDAIVELLATAADAGRAFDRPSADTVRAIQPDLSAYLLDDWLECLLRAFPENAVVAHRTALRLAFEHARERWGLVGERLGPGGGVERAIESAVVSALARGLIVRVGAGGLMRLDRQSPCPDLPRATESGNGSEYGFVEGWSRALERLEPVHRFLLSRRSGWYGRRESLSLVAQRLGLTLERAQQLELEAWQRVEAGSGWAEELRTRLTRALAGARSLPVRRLALDDAWWKGVEQHLDLAEAVFESVLDGALERVELGLPHRPVFFARFTAAQLERAMQGLLETAARIETPANIDAYRGLCDAACAELDAGLCEYLREALEARLELDPEEPNRVLSFNASDGAALETFPVDTRVVDSEALLRLEDVLRSVFRTAGTPLSLEAVADRLQKRLDVDPTTLLQRLTSPPFVRRNSDQYGLLARDVPGGHEAIAAVLNDVCEALRTSQRALGFDQACDLVRARVSRAWSPELVRSLIASDPVLSLSAGHDATLRRWEHARLLPHGTLSHGALLCPGVPASARPRFEKLAQQPPSASDVVLQLVAAELRRLEHSADADDLCALPLARQLADLSARLLEHTATESAATQSISRAAIDSFLDAVAPDEDDLDAPLIDRDRLAEARAVMAAVLRWLGLDWLEAAPLLPASALEAPSN